MFIRYFKYYLHSILQPRKSVANAVYVFFCLLLIFACKKAAVEADEAPESPLTGTRTQLTLDSVFLYTRQVYLWGEALPDYQTFNPRKYINHNDEMQNLKQELFDISQYQIDPLSQRPYEYTSFPGVSKYSFLSNEQSGSGFFAASKASSGNSLISFLISGDVGYLNLAEFGDLQRSAPVLDKAFQNFSNSGIQCLIIDLRDNNGGYIESAAYLANLLARPEMSGKVMFSQHFNSKLQQGKVQILRNQPYLDENNQPVYVQGRKATYADVDFTVAGNTVRFEKKGSLQSLKSIYVIVNGNTASASELLISALFPYLDITVIGRQTYGKPVGSFGIKIDRYILYAPSFQIKNANGEGNYYNGIVPDLEVPDEEIGATPEEIIINIQVLGKLRNSRSDLKLPKRKEETSVAGRREISRIMIREKLRLKQ